MTLTVTDLFCGAGGSSLGAKSAGLELVMAANHWQTAIDVHQVAFPDAAHDVADISQVDPRRYPRTNILLASPECTNHSQARGVSRKRRQQWYWACTSCGAICETPAEPAASIIDWDLDCPRIGDRKRPLADATRARILAGLQRYGWAPITTSGAGNVHERTPGNRSRSVDEPLPVQQTTATTALATPPGFLFQTAHGGRTADLGAPHPTVCASDDRHSLVVHMRGTETAQVKGSATPTGEPVRTVSAGGIHHGLLLANTTSNVPRSTDEPMSTVVAGTQRHGLLMRNNGTKKGEAWAVTPTEDPAKTMTTKGHQSLLVPYNGNGHAKPAGEPLGTQPATDRWSLIEEYGEGWSGGVDGETGRLYTDDADPWVPTQADLDAIVDDCGFRMLEPYEIAAAMAFPDRYIPRDLTKRDQVKLAGNAVTPPVMTWIAGRIAQAIEAAG